VVVAQRLRKGSCGSPRGAKRLVGDAVKQTRRLLGKAGRCWCGWTRPTTAATPSTPRSPAAPPCPSPCAWTQPSRPRSPPSATTRGPRSSTRTRSSTRPLAPGCPRRRSPRCPTPRSPAGRRPSGSPGRLVVRRIPDVHASRKQAAGQGTLFDLWRFHAFFTTVPADQLDAVAADKTHRGHAIIEQVHADLKPQRWRTCPPGGSPPTPPGSCSRSSRSTSPAPPPPSPRHPSSQGDHRHRAPQADPRPGPGRDLGPPDHPAPAPALALAAAWTHLFDRVADPPATASP
jgi:hypothetical protein